MVTRFAKILLLFSVALFYTVVVFNNTTDYYSNYEFVHHVMMMDSMFPGNHGMWRAVHPAFLHHLFYISIIMWETLTAVLCWWGGARLVSRVRGTAAAFHSAKGVAIAALALSLLMWMVAFLTIGGEWFLMWQSKTWNGQEAAFRMFTVVGVVLIFVSMREADGDA